jgi:tripartite-type tricarboxylate transporter receptor subunit TctC
MTSAKRSPLYPDTPTLEEAGVKDYDVSTWWGIVGPPNMPPALVAQLNKALNQASGTGAVRDRLKKEGADYTPGPPEALKQTLSAELASWRAVVKNGNLQQ